MTRQLFIGSQRISQNRLTPHFSMLYGEGIPSFGWGHNLRRESQVTYGARFAFG